MTLPDSTFFARLDALFDPRTDLKRIVEALDDAGWEVRQAALFALSRRGPAAAGALPSIMAALDREDGVDLYGAPDYWSLGDAAADPALREAWRCRFRVKQAACLALGRLLQDGPPDRAVIDRLARYAVDQAEDYPVRAAACRALGAMGADAARPALEQAAADTEWCTATEARKALAGVKLAVGGSVGSVKPVV